MSLIYVKAAQGSQMPVEGKPRTYITDATPVAVEGSHYYRKAIIDGDLVELSEDEWAAFHARAEATAKAAARATAKVATQDAAQ